MEIDVVDDSSGIVLDGLGELEAGVDLLVRRDDDGVLRRQWLGELHGDVEGGVGGEGELLAYQGDPVVGRRRGVLAARAECGPASSADATKATAGSSTARERRDMTAKLCPMGAREMCRGVRCRRGAG